MTRYFFHLNHLWFVCCCLVVCWFLHQICLKELGNDPERVISGVLEDNLPLHLKDLDFSMMSKKQAVPDSSRGQGTTVKTTESLVDQRECVFDNDEFDVFRKPEEIDLSRVQIGKKYVNF